MQILVVSGFLGAGKTTFISELVRHTDKMVAIFENELGNVGIDGDLLNSATASQPEEKVNIWELTEGCICCSLKGDFAESILTIANVVNPDILIVEPSGVGMLSSILTNIQKIVYDKIQLLAPLTLVDCVNADLQCRQYEPLFNDQVKAATFLTLTKQGNMEQCAKESLLADLAKRNPEAVIWAEDYTSWEPAQWERLLSTPYGHTQAPAEEEIALTMQSIAFKNVSFTNAAQFESYISVVMSGRFGQVYRAKGFLPIGGQWGRFDIVGSQYSLEEIKPMGEAKVVVIGEQLDIEALATIFNGERILGDHDIHHGDGEPEGVIHEQHA